jgi:dipeptidyl aminopeptidase/acylaminoacyl peptidase
MSQLRLASAAALAASATLALTLPVAAGAQTRSVGPNASTSAATPAKKAAPNSIEAFMGPPSPLEISAAKKRDKIAWVSYERGMRNVYVASGPDFKPIKVTQFNKDDGVDLGSVRLSDDGSIVTFIRGSGQNRNGWVANPSHYPEGGERAVWAANTDGSGAWRLAVITNTEVGGGGGRGGGSPELSPDGRYIVFVKDGQIYRAKTARGSASRIDTAGVPFLKQWGRQANPQWSPDGSKLAFVSTRDNHSFIGVYDTKTNSVSFISPSVDFDNSPTWSPDGKRLAFVRRPGTPFGAQQQQGQGGIGNPSGPAAAQAGAPAGRGGRGNGRGGGGGGGGGRGRGGDDAPVVIDGLYRAAFPGGYTLSLMVADVATGKAQEFWHAQPGDRVFSNINNITWAGDHLVFGAQQPNDEWDRFFSLSISSPQQQPTLLTTTDGLINDGVADRTFTTTAISRDGKTMFYATNANDIEKRHIWSVPVAGGTPRQISSSWVEVSPTPLANGKQLAVLSFGSDQPASVGIVPVDSGATKVVFPTNAMLKDFPKAQHVMPEIVITKAPDGLEVHNQLFLPKDLKPGEKRPAVVFVHGGPARQMLPAYHYMQFYHWAYAYNQYLASQGYVVMSINYRLGIGYGRSFRQPGNTQAQGNAEYQDVLAGAKYLQSRPDVDPNRVGIWGLSYGGLLVAQSLARNSDVFVAGVDMAGVHLYGQSLDSTNLAYQSSAAAHVNTWKSPVYFVHGDDDRNVDFSQTIGLVNLLRVRNVYHELTVIPDDTHESLIHSRWIDIWNHSTDFLKRFVWEKQTPPAMTSSSGR